MDLTLVADPARAQVLTVGSTGIASTFAILSNDTDEGRQISMYNVAPMAGSGEFLVVTYDSTHGASVLPFGVGAVANEGLIPIVPGAGIPRTRRHQADAHAEKP